MLLPACPKNESFNSPPTGGGEHPGCELTPRGKTCSLCATKKECFISNQGTGLFYSLPLVWPHSQELFHFPEPTPPHSPLTAKLDRVACVCARAHAHAQQCVFVCVFELAWILLQFDPTQIFLKEKQRRGGRLRGRCTRPAEPLHRSQ